MGVAKGHPHLGQPVQVRSDRLGMATERTDPVVHVVDGNEQHVGLSERWVMERSKGQANKQQPFYHAVHSTDIPQCAQ